jgi:hypothetical protein
LGVVDDVRSQYQLERPEFAVVEVQQGAEEGVPGLYLLGVIECPLTAYPSIPLDDDEIRRIGLLLTQAGLEAR